MQRGLREFFRRRDFRIGIGFDEIGRAVMGQAEIDPRIAIELQRLADALDQRAQLGFDRR